MKKRFLCPILPKPNVPSLLSEEEARHATRVMRLQEGDLVEAIDGKGHWAVTKLRIRGVPPQLVWVEPDPTSSNELKNKSKIELTSSLILELAILKGPAMEWIVEKAVELGVSRLIPIVTDHTVVQTKSKGPDVFRQRWQKIADQSLKQCGRLEQMTVEEPIRLADLLIQSTSQPPTASIRVWCDEVSQSESPYLLNWLQVNWLQEERAHSPEIRILIGPEGGWSNNEREFLSRESHVHPIQRVHLGPQVLRAETAALFSVSVASSFLWAQTLQHQIKKG